MKLPSLIGLASLSLLHGSPMRADSTAPVDAAQRNVPFAPAATLPVEKKAPALDEAVQDKRVEKNTLPKPAAVMGDRRAAIDVRETRAKDVRDQASRRPEVVEQPMSAFNRREAPFATAADATRPAMVAKYQDSLTAASTANMARFPALDRATAAKLNRFVFRKNAPDSGPVTRDAAVTPAAGGSPVRN